MAEYKVLRRHDGDKEYHAGDTRTADPATVKHLVTLGVLELAGKAEAGHVNKAESALLNKAEAAKEAAAKKAAAKKAAAKDKGE